MTKATEISSAPRLLEFLSELAETEDYKSLQISGKICSKTKQWQCCSFRSISLFVTSCEQLCLGRKKKVICLRLSAYCSVIWGSSYSSAVWPLNVWLFIYSAFISVATWSLLCHLAFFRSFTELTEFSSYEFECSAVFCANFSLTSRFYSSSNMLCSSRMLERKHSNYPVSFAYCFAIETSLYRHVATGVQNSYKTITVNFKWWCPLISGFLYWLTTFINWPHHDLIAHLQFLVASLQSNFDPYQCCTAAGSTIQLVSN